MPLCLYRKNTNCDKYGVVVVANNPLFLSLKNLVMKTRLLLPSFLCIALLASSFFIVGALQAQAPPANVANQLQNILDNALPNEQGAGVTMGIYVPGKWSWQSASGNAIAGITTGYPATTATGTHKFRVGSITKMFTAIAILQLEEAGLLQTTDLIAQHLRTTLVNDTIPNGTQITINNLLNHTSGLGDAAANDSCQQAALSDLTRTFSLEENIYCGSDFAALPPNILWSYSNTNYAILAMIVEEASGQSYESYLNDSIIVPLGLANTYIPTSVEDEIATPHMGCYWWLIPGTYRIDMSIVDPTLYKGWAGMVSTTEDLMTFYEALRSGGLISNTSYNKMFTITAPSTYYGLGTEMVDIAGTDYFGHSGEVANTSGLYFCNISTPEAPNGYYIAYNFNYQGVNFTNNMDVPVYNLMSTLTGMEELPLQVEALYPNPASNMVNIQLATANPEAIQYQLLDTKGAVVQGVKLQYSSVNRLVLNLSQVNNGIYFLKITDGTYAITRKISVVR